MAIYKEKPTKLNLNLSSNSNTVTIEFNSFQGTVGSLMFIYKGAKVVKVGEKIKMDSANKLKDKTLTFGGAANNPDGEKISLGFIISEENGESIEYKFTDDYSGTPEYTNDQEPNYEFKVNFK